MIADSASERRRRHTALAVWLFAVAAMVFLMVIIGGLTRLTGSGLSMVEWRPVTGWLPPMSSAEWEVTFASYRQFPEYQKVNAGMTLEEFQGIFWLEYIHRLWGRLIGVVFAVPFLVFLARGWIDRAMMPRLVGLLVLGGLQGVLGWYMVKSGLVDRPDVSQYRLAAHFVAALAIYAALFGIAMGLLRSRPAPAAPDAPRRHGYVLLGFVLVTAASGAFVAGLDAGYGYNTFPLMDGALLPEGLFAGSPWWMSMFEDRTTVQFTHRVLALTTVAVALGLWLRVLSSQAGRAAQWAAHATGAAALLQASLGIATLLLVVPLPLAAAHQAGSLVLLSAALWLAFELAPAAAAATPVVAKSTADSRAFSGE